MVVVGRVGGGGGFLPVHICLILIIVARRRVRKATITGKLAIDLNNGVMVINHIQLLELSLIYIYASFAHNWRVM